MKSWKTIGPLLVIGAATGGSFGGCTKQDPATNYPTPGASQGDEPPPAKQAPKDERSSDLNDRQIIGILTTVDAGEIAIVAVQQYPGKPERIPEMIRQRRIFSVQECIKTLQTD